MKIETVMSDFSSEAELERWLVDVVHERWCVGRRLRGELMRAWVSRLEALRAHAKKDYVVAVEIRVFLTRLGPRRPARLARQQAELQEQWRRLREEADNG